MQQERVFNISKWPNRCRRHRKDLDKPKAKPKSQKTSKCIDCNIDIFRGSKRCKPCSGKSRRTAKKNHCVDCGVGIHRQAKRCKSCYDKKQTTGGDPRVRFQNSKEWAEIRDSAFKRDNYTCQHCNARGGVTLNAHHIRPYKDYPELRLELGNLLTVCEPCHKKIHGSGSRESHKICKLTLVQVKEIKNLIEQGLKLKDIAQMYSVSSSNISSIKRGCTWVI
jgi:5-methylcytosine-specific restriction protein A